MQDVADVEGDTPLKSAAVGEDFDQAFLIVRGVDGDEAMVMGRYGLVVIHLREQVDVVGEA